MERLRVDDLLSLGPIGRGIVFVSLAAALALGAGSAMGQQIPAASVSGGAAPVSVQGVYSSRPEDQQYRIGVGDVLDVRVFNKAQFSRDGIRVGGTGTIRLPFVESEVTAVCQTEAQLATVIAERYKEYLNNPQVDVYIREYNSQPVAVMGAVRSPSRLQLRSRVRLLDLLSYSGGLTENAGRIVQIVHTMPVGTCDAQAGPADDNDTVAGAISSYALADTLTGLETSNPVVNPGDIITIPVADQVFIVGNVVHPSIVLLKEPITITRAIAMAGGLMPDTKKNKVRITRQQAGSPTPTQLFVDLNAIEKRQADDMVLVSGDIVDVPTSEGKRLIKTLLGSFVPSVGQLPLRVVP
jgi:polysaccharide export outer membrane protein